ncbi:IS3 family transposase [Agromyces archimandritae]|uniref:IS3 family transposase n=1 Tax=Agromyces archimandritae TaxID=2781962 RepID=UPI003CC7FFC4
MSSSRRKFTDEFKADAVQLVVQGKRAVAQVARELGINESSLGYWVKAYRQQHPDPQTAPMPVDAARIARLEAENRRLIEENAFLKKGRGLLRPGTAVSVKFTLIHAEKANHTVEFMASMLGVTRAGYYAWARRQGTASPAATRRAALSELIMQIHHDSAQTSGFRRVVAELGRRGIHASEGLVRKLMREAGLFGVQPRTRKRTTIPAADAAERPDLLCRDFTADHPGTRLVGDITYLRTGQGWLYLATVIDLFNREVVGWSMADHMRTELVADALRMAHAHGRVEHGAIFHSDRGSVYTSQAYADIADSLGVRLSVGRTGVCWDNAVAESFFSMLKNEMYHRYHFTTRAQARFHVMQYIEVFYNRRRLHSSLGYRTPAEVRAQHDPQTAIAA